MIEEDFAVEEIDVAQAEGRPRGSLLDRMPILRRDRDRKSVV